MAKGTKTSTERLPIPFEVIARLEDRLGRSYEGWDRSPPKHVSPSPEGQVPGAYFDVDAVCKVVRQLRAMPHTDGRWGGTPFDPEPWQVVWILAPVYGWKNPDGTRIVREVWDETGRKSGKTSLSTRLGLIMLTGDGEYGAQVYAAAGSKEQAGFAFTPAKLVAQRSPALRNRLHVLTSVIRAPKTGGLYRVLSKAGELAHGANVSCALIDEIHVHKTRELIDALDSGTGARTQPLIFYTTTANDGDDTTIYGELHGRAIRLAEGSIADPTVYVVIWAAEKTDDPFSEATILKANPNYPISPSKSYMERKIRKAQQSPSWLPTYLRLHLNLRQAEEGKRVDWGWNESAGMVVLEELKGKVCWGGLVAASVQDLTAIAWTFHCPQKAHEDEWWTIWRHFIPEARLPSLRERTNQAADDWVKRGLLTVTEGDEFDIATHLKQIRADAAMFDVREIAYAAWGVLGLAQPLVAEGAAMVPIYANTPSSALLDLEQLVRGQKYRHAGNPLMAWQINNLVLRQSPAGITKIDPKLSHDVVPGALAAEMALRRALLAQERKPSVLHGMSF